MHTEKDKELARRNFADLGNNPYPGRGIVIGLDGTSERIVQMYWIMGRSGNSRNRIFKADDLTGRLYTEAADASKMTDPSLIIYNAMRESSPFYVVSNGDQTDTVMDSLSKGPFYLNVALDHREYEPDEPNFTQRITAVCRLSKGGDQINELSILRKSKFGLGCDRFTYELDTDPGFGYCITTYADDGSPLPSFFGEPLLMPLIGNISEIAKTYWDALNPENRVALAVKTIERDTGCSDIHIINKY